MRTILMAALMLSGCAAGPMAAPRLGGGEWRAADINGTPVIAGSAITFKLDGGTVSGHSGCNNYSGPYQNLSDQRLRMGTLVTTRMACAADAVTQQESRYISILQGAQGYSFYPDGSLSLIAADGRAIRFRRN